MTEGKRGPRLEAGGWMGNCVWRGVCAGVVECQVARQARTYQGVQLETPGSANEKVGKSSRDVHGTLVHKTRDCPFASDCSPGTRDRMPFGHDWADRRRG